MDEQPFQMNNMYEINIVKYYEKIYDESSGEWYGEFAGDMYSNKQNNKFTNGVVNNEHKLNNLKNIYFIDTEYFHFISTYPYTVTVKYDNYIENQRYIEYSFDCIEWTVIKPFESIYVDLNVKRKHFNQGEYTISAYSRVEDIFGRYIIYFRGMMGEVPGISYSANSLFISDCHNDNSSGANPNKVYNHCWEISNAPIGYIRNNTIAAGRINTLINYKNKDITLGRYAFSALFFQLFALIDATNIILEGDVSYEAYELMFAGCYYLKHGPYFKNEKLSGIQACLSMFNGCAFLEEVPKSFSENVKEIRNGSCVTMFSTCEVLTETGELPAKLLETSIETSRYYGTYAAMFSSCIALKKSSTILPSLVLSPSYYNGMQGAYNEMFKNCQLLETVPDLPSNNINSAMYESMFYNCKNITNIPNMPKIINTIIDVDSFPPINTYDVLPAFYRMFYGCEKLIDVSTFPIPVAYRGLCYQMFYGCKNIKRIMQLSAKTLYSQCYYEMFKGCTSLTLQSEGLVDPTYEFWAIPESNRVTNSTAQVTNLQYVTNMFAQTSSIIITPIVNTRLEEGETEESRPLVKYLQPAAIE